MFWEVSRLLLRLLIGTEHRSSDSQHSIVNVFIKKMFHFHEINLYRPDPCDVMLLRNDLEACSK